ncbi:MAG: DNA mismatch repair protein MutS [Flavobacteriaceae bacterium]|nr:DNA mismatch repair protein MutS [Flavobacteriaceae bacterium]RZW52035.1 MAG: DNA mismatch repair protein MutS [Flavobacteriaceae bacterium]
MIKIHEKSLLDLEFPTVLEQVAQYAITELGQAEVLAIEPFSNSEIAISALKELNEYVASYENDHKIPNHGFDDLIEEIKLLGIENTILEIESFRKIAAIVKLSNALITFFEKFKDYYPTLYLRSSKLEVNTLIPKEIDLVIDKYGEVKDDASETLFSIRKDLKAVRSKLNSSFTKALSTYNTQGYLDDIKESVVENKRVLAVKSMYRRKVKGAILGSSKTGSIVYIEPETTLTYQRNLNNLEYEESEELKKILKVLTEIIREYKPLLEAYQQFLIAIDLIYAKAKYAHSMNAVLPILSDEKIVELKEAYHPLLYLNNKKIGEKTYPQTLEMNAEKRIIVISGPNAGGKSITLKTVGLLQIMLQSGLLVPVHERSTMCFFDRILSDIGDNQSIENHLSTYSYRLKQMNYFLKKCNQETLFLIDEFGTGSDPELGGALAEAFLEVFYERKAFGIITTHYANLKMLANEQPFMQNANMLFDERSLQPIYKLVLGQAGSSFTFEVAQKNGIPFNLINKAKKKIERGKVRFDKTIAKLQKERSKLERTERSLKVNEQKKLAETDKLEEVNARIQKKLENYQELYDSNQRLIYLGQKVNTLAERYMDNHKKRELMAELFKLVQIENSKRKKLSASQKKKKKIEETQINREVKKKVAVIRKKKKIEKQKKVEKPKPRPKLKIGDRVRLEDGRAVGSIDRIEKNKAVVNYGMFTTNVDIDQLELVEAVK